MNREGAKITSQFHRKDREEHRKGHRIVIPSHTCVLGNSLTGIQEIRAVALQSTSHSTQRRLRPSRLCGSFALLFSRMLTTEVA